MKIKELLNSPEKWTQGAEARDKDNKVVKKCGPIYPNATCWCLLGALDTCYPYNNSLTETNTQIYYQLQKRLGCAVSSWNDTPGRTFAEVQSLVNELDI